MHVYQQIRQQSLARWKKKNKILKKCDFYMTDTFFFDIIF